MKNKKENKENTEINSEGLSENLNIKENKNIMENTENIENNMDISNIEKEYQEIQKEISDKTKKGDFQGIVNLLSEKSEIIQKYTEYQKQKEQEKQEKLKEIENKIQEKIKEIDLLKEQIRDLKQKKKEIQGYTDNNNNSIRVINRENHEYSWNSIKTDKAINIIFEILKTYNITEEAWREFNKKHSISWHNFIELTQKGKYQQKNNLLELFSNNMDNLNQFYEHVKEITIS